MRRGRDYVEKLTEMVKNRARACVYGKDFVTLPRICKVEL